MSKITLRYFKKDCMGCHSCEVACMQEHGLTGGARLVRIIEDSPDFIPIYCHHCANAPCKGVCPVDAIIRNDRGIVLIDKALCIGCKECMEACPFGAMQYNEEQEVAVKCDLCIHRIENGEAPACSTVCGTGCIFWGDTKQMTTRILADL